MFGIAKVARVLGALFFCNGFVFKKRFRIQVPNGVGQEQKSSGAYRPRVDAHL